MESLAPLRVPEEIPKIFMFFLLSVVSTPYLDVEVKSALACCGYACPGFRAFNLYIMFSVSNVNGFR
jgi:hypothetical protein